jgi:hypothetical protein
MEPKDQIAFAIDLAKQGDQAGARKLIAQAVRADPSIVEGWWALANLLEDPRRRMQCLKQVIKLDPDHYRAQALLAKLQGKPEPSVAKEPLPVSERILAPSAEKSEAFTPVREPQTSRSIETPEEIPLPKRRSRSLVVLVIVAVLIVVAALIIFFSFGGSIRNLIGNVPVGNLEGERSDVVVPTLPPSWTATPSPTDLPPATATSTTTPFPTPTPFPQTYLDSTWVIEIEARDGWRGADEMVELSDGGILVAGVNKVGINHETIWLARISPVGAVEWVKNLTLPGGGTFHINSLDAGSNGSALLNGDYNPPGGSGALEIDDVMLSITTGGTIEWQTWGYSRQTQMLDDGTMLLFDGLGVRQWSEDQQDDWAFDLDLGEGYLEPPEYYPAPRLVQGYRTTDGTLLLTGTIEDLAVPGDGVARGGPDAGYTSYWFAGFTQDGELRWKHFYAIDAVEQFRIYGTVIEDATLVVGGSKRQRVQTERDLYYLPLYSWVRIVSSSGRTLVHRRYLDLPRLDGLEATADGGFLLYGLNYVPEGENVFGIRQPRIVKLDADGNVEWARQLQDDFWLRAVLPLSDGTTLISYGPDLRIARLDAQGNLTGCEQIIPSDTRMRVDNEPAQFDIANTVPLALETEEPGAERSDEPNFNLTPVNFTAFELCRTFPDS